jgi:hypothetical protein
MDKKQQMVREEKLRYWRPIINAYENRETEYSGLRVPPIRDRIPANRAMIPLCFQ